MTLHVLAVEATDGLLRKSGEVSCQPSFRAQKSGQAATCRPIGLWGVGLCRFEAPKAMMSSGG
jgi:hypothetical protein